MARPGGESGEANVHAAWRLAVAERAAQVYASNPKLAGALARRGDDLAVHDLLSRAGQAVFGAVLAVNGVYSPHRMIKWQRHLIGELDLMPEHFAERLVLLGASSNVRALREAETLLTDTVQLV